LYNSCTSILNVVLYRSIQHSCFYFQISPILEQEDIEKPASSKLPEFQADALQEVVPEQPVVIDVEETKTEESEKTQVSVEGVQPEKEVPIESQVEVSDSQLQQFEVTAVDEQKPDLSYY